MNVDRLRGLMEEQGLSQSGLAARIGATQGAVQQILAGTTRRSRLLPDIARHFGVSVDFLLGLCDDPRPHRESAFDGHRVEAITDERVVGLQYLNLASDKMTSRFYGDELLDIDLTYFDRNFVARLTLAPSTQLFLAHGFGDAMMPTLFDTDIALVDETQNVIQSQDRIWVLESGGALMVRRVRLLEQRRVMLVSDNPAVRDEEVADDAFSTVGRVIWSSRAR